MSRTLELVWSRFLPRARIGRRIVTAVVLAMAVVLAAAGGFVYWRISYALDRQLDQDLADYANGVRSALERGGALPEGGPGLAAQTYTRDGSPLARSDPATGTLLTPGEARGADRMVRTVDLGRFLPPPASTPYRIGYQAVDTPSGEVILAAAISRHKHDEALRELLLQLGAADLATVLAAGAVGWGATRAALGPVERYRRAAAGAGGDPSVRLPIDEGREDELARLGTTLNDLLAQLEAGHRRERQFLADASHELRSPLALLAAEVEWARNRPRSAEDVDQVLTSIADQTERLAALAEALLSYEEASEPAPRATARVRLPTLIEDAVRPHRAAAHELGRTLTVETDDVAVEVEVRWLELAVSNLVANALRHGKGAVVVTARNGDGLRIEVGDEGPGIPESLGQAAFERFARAEESRTTPGHGLGLAIVAAVAARHHGTATVIPGGIRLDLS